MVVVDSVKGESKTAFSIEVLPPVKGMGTGKLFTAIDELKEFNPRYINITTHCSETAYREIEKGIFERYSYRRRPGTVAIAAAIQSRYNIPVVPHILCSGYTRDEIEYILLDLQFLGITNLLVLRGDRAKDEAVFTPAKNGYHHALELEEQINNFNRGFFVDGSPIKEPLIPFHYGVAGYPEKHFESPNLEQDIHWLKKKVEAGADYIVTQMFYDNRKYFEFLKRIRQAGIDVPVIPGIKPFSKLSQLSMIPKTFNVELPQELVSEAIKCKDDNDARALGIEWCIHQCRELVGQKVPCLHFYTVGASDCVREVAKVIY